MSLLCHNPHRTLVSKEFTFDAAHHLFHYEGKVQVPARPHLSPCRSLSVDYLDERGMTYDFGDLKSYLQKLTWILTLDHRYLNETLALYEHDC